MQRHLLGAFGIENDADICEFITQRYIVSSDADEAKNYIATIEVLRLLGKKLATGHKGYVILPTTACNARCFYCYESGIEFKSMDDAMAEAVVSYFADSKPEGSIAIHWFGGERIELHSKIGRFLLHCTLNGHCPVESEDCRSAAGLYTKRRVLTFLN